MLLRVFQTFPGFSRLFPELSRLIQTFQTVAGVFPNFPRLFQTVPGVSRTSQDYSGYSRASPTVPWISPAFQAFPDNPPETVSSTAARTPRSTRAGGHPTPPHICSHFCSSLQTPVTCAKTAIVLFGVSLLLGILSQERLHSSVMTRSCHLILMCALPCCSPFE